MASSRSERARRRAPGSARRCGSTGIMRAVEATVTFVPGFMQRGEAWQPVAVQARRNATESELPRLRDVDVRGAAGRDPRRDAPRAVALVGYSMGGRLALHAALRDPDRFGALVLVGVSAGIEDAPRARGPAADGRVAGRVDGAPLDRGGRGALGAPARVRQPVRALRRPAAAGRLSHDPRKLAQLLRSGGTGRARAGVGPARPTLRCPVLLTAGEQDRRYATAAQRMAERLPRRARAADRRTRATRPSSRRRTSSRR